MYLTFDHVNENIYLIRAVIATGLTEGLFRPTGVRFEYIVIEINY